MEESLGVKAEFEANFFSNTLKKLLYLNLSGMIRFNEKLKRIKLDEDSVFSYVNYYVNWNSKSPLDISVRVREIENLSFLYVVAPEYLKLFPDKAGCFVNHSDFSLYLVFKDKTTCVFNNGVTVTQSVMKYYRNIRYFINKMRGYPINFNTAFKEYTNDSFKLLVLYAEKYDAVREYLEFVKDCFERDFIEAFKSYADYYKQWISDTAKSGVGGSYGTLLKNYRFEAPSRRNNISFFNYVNKKLAVFLGYRQETNKIINAVVALYNGESFDYYIAYLSTGTYRPLRKLKPIKLVKGDLIDCIVDKEPMYFASNKEIFKIHKGKLQSTSVVTLEDIIVCAN